MNYRELESKISAISVSDEGTKKLKDRRKMMRKMSTAANRLQKAKNVDFPRIRRGVVGMTFTVTQGAVTDSKNGLLFKVEIKGIGVGTIKLINDEYRFFPNDKSTDVTQEEKNRGWAWSNKSADGENIRDYLKNLKDEISSEREIQWQMFRAIKNNDTECLKRIQPVAIAGFPCEIPTWILRDGRLAENAGNIDALIRKLGGGKGASYLVFELKGPKDKSPEIALRQALGYAIALSIESNDKDDKHCQKEYRALFGGKGDAPLNYGAVIVIKDTDENREKAKKALEKFKPIADQDYKPLVDRIGVLLYEWEDTNKKAINWSWLDDADPR